MSDLDKHYQQMSVFEKQCLGFLRDIALANFILVVLVTVILIIDIARML